ncbi:MAG: hypothetical protein U5K69_01545 [Balneolaceae bacterium]|nr:hypothetical protein [Balneolaceae bacterium]
MKDNGFKIGAIVVFLTISIYYLWPTVAYWLEQNYIQDLPQAERTEYVEENEQRLQNLRQEMLSLGLDLQGGMHVTLEVGTPQLVYELAGQYADTTLQNIINVADERALQNGTDFINEFVQEFEQRDSNARLSRYFRSDADNITRRSTNEEIQQYLQSQRDDAVERAIDIIRTRVDRYGVTEPSILKQGNNRVVVELPGVANKERVRSLLKGTARLEFRLAAPPRDLNSARKQIVGYFDQQATSGDTTDTAQVQNGQNALMQVLNPRPRNQYVFGYAAADDTARVNELLNRTEVQDMIPRNIDFLWGATPFQTTQQGTEMFELIGVREYG